MVLEKKIFNNPHHIFVIISPYEEILKMFTPFDKVSRKVDQLAEQLLSTENIDDVNCCLYTKFANLWACLHS